MTKNCSSKPSFAEAFEEVSACHSVITQLNPLRRHCQLSSSLSRAEICSQATRDTKPIYSAPSQAILGEEAPGVMCPWSANCSRMWEWAEPREEQRAGLGCRQGVSALVHLISLAIIHCSAPRFVWGMMIIFSLLLLPHDISCPS